MNLGQTDPEAEMSNQLIQRRYQRGSPGEKETSSESENNVVEVSDHSK